MSAETGVGPSIASGSQICNGTCADLPAAPAKTPSANRVNVVAPMVPANAACWISATLNVPVFVQIMRMPTMKPTSPTRVVMNAFLAAAAALGLWNQKPINRNEQSPTSSQKMKIIKTLSASTSPSIDAVNSDI